MLVIITISVSEQPCDVFIAEFRGNRIFRLLSHGNDSGDMHVTFSPLASQAWKIPKKWFSLAIIYDICPSIRAQWGISSSSPLTNIFIAQRTTHCPPTRVRREGISRGAQIDVDRLHGAFHPAYTYVTFLTNTSGPLRSARASRSVPLFSRKFQTHRPWRIGYLSSILSACVRKMRKCQMKMHWRAFLARDVDGSSRLRPFPAVFPRARRRTNPFCNSSARARALKINVARVGGRRGIRSPCATRLFTFTVPLR